MRIKIWRSRNKYFLGLQTENTRTWKTQVGVYYLPSSICFTLLTVISLMKTENSQFIFLVSTPLWNNFLGKYNRQKIKYFISQRKDENIAGHKSQVPYRKVFRKYNIPPFYSAYLHSGTSFVTYLTPSSLHGFDSEQKIKFL